MLRKISTLLAVALFFTFATKLYSQEKPVQQKFAKKIDVNAEIDVPLSNVGTIKGAKGELIFNTNYDYPANSQVRPMLVLHDLDGDGVKDPIMVGMSRLADNVDGNRYVNLGMKVEGEWVVFSVYDVNKYTGWGSIQSAEGGNLEGNALIMAHQGGQTVPAIYNYEMDEVTLPTPFASIFPSFAYSSVNNKTMYLGDGGAFATTTAWESFDSLNTVAGFFAEVSGDTSLASGGFDTEVGVHVSPDGNYFSAFSTVEKDGNVVLGTPPDRANLATLIYSGDAGATWNYEEVAKCGVVGTISNRPDYAPLLANFGQSQSLIDNNGVVHVGINGYAVDMANDTAAVFPALYWNSRDKNFIALTNGVEETDPNIIGAFPGNGIGNAYESVGTTADGGFVFVAWQSPEFKDGSLNIASTGVYYTNISYAYSTDGGRTFSEPQILVGETDVDECYPYVCDEVEYNADKGTVKIHYLYYLDAIPGVSLFGQGDGSDDGAWYYDTIEIPYTPNSVDGEVVENYSLSQNYPNPFNPTTVIKYSLAKPSNVTLKVYDLVGQEVATLVNAKQTAGKHNVSFDASNLSSGVYFYTLRAGDYTATKKMMLLK